MLRQGTLLFSGFLSSCDRDLGFPIEFQQMSQASSPVEAWNSALPLSCRRGVRSPVQFSHGTWNFPRGATGESDIPLYCEGILGAPFESVQGNEALSRIERDLAVLST